MSLIQRLLTAGDHADIVEFHAVLADDVIIHAPAGLSTTGADAEWESWHRARQAMPDLTHRVIDALSSPDFEAARVEVTGTFDGEYGGITARGKTFRFDQAVFARVRDSRIVELWEIVDVEMLRAQVQG